MDEPTAWLLQARADWQAAELMTDDRDGSLRCQAIAKWQQTIEKATKGLISALHHSGRLGTNVRLRHEVEPLLESLIHLPRAAKNRAIQRQIHGLLDQNTRLGIKALEELIPRPDAGRNTEYPYPDDRGEWTHPAAPDTFTATEAQRFRDLAFRLLRGAERLVMVIRLGRGES